MTKQNSKVFKRLVILIFYALVGIIGVFNLFFPSISSGFGRFQPDLGDAYFNAYILEHGFKFFWDSTYEASFYSPTFFYPTKLVTTYSDNLLGSAPIYWMFRAFLDWMPTFELWAITAAFFTYVFFIVWLRYLKVSPVLSALSSFIFAFGISRVIQLVHPQLLPQFLTPMAFIFLHKFITKPSVKSLNLFGLFVFLQTTAGYYTGWFLILSLCLLVVIGAVFLKKEYEAIIAFISQRRKETLISLALWLLTFVLFWGPYLFTSLRYRDLWNWEYIRDNLASPYSYLLVPASNLWYPVLNKIDIPIKPTFEQYLFNGSFMVIIVTLGFYFLLKVSKDDLNLRFAKGVFTVGVLLLLISVRINGYSFWYFIYHVVPGADGVRYVSRIWIIAYFCILTSGAVFINYIIVTLTRI